MTRRILVTLLVVLLSVLIGGHRLDSAGAPQLDAAFKRAVVTFAVARSLNGVISVVQGTEINLSPAGLGATLAVGELLDPVNDMVERFSWVMLLSSVSLSVQQIILALGSTPAFKIGFCLIGALFVLFYWLPARAATGGRELLFRVLVLLAALRLAAPGYIMINEWVYRQVMQPSYEQSSEVVQRTSRELEEKVHRVGALNGEVADTPQDDTADEPWFRLELPDPVGAYRDTRSALQELARDSVTALDAAMENIIRLITIFLINSLLLPLVLLWLLLRLCGALSVAGAALIRRPLY